MSSFLHLPLHGSHSSSVTANPTTFFAILDHYLRRPDGQQRAVGVLLGVRSEDGTEVEIRNSFAVPHKEPEVGDLTIWDLNGGTAVLRMECPGSRRDW